MSQFAEPQCLARLEWKNFGETVENPEAQCEFSRKDSGPSHSLLWTCCPSAAVELVCMGGPKAGTRHALILGSVLPSRSMETPSCLKLQVTKNSVMLLDWPTRAAVAMAWPSEPEAWAPTISQ
ncbi:hypothetical protein P7K49_017009 [Saguinus oedipus]|uniref:Uncharacterized protein n=1 Tax=Saguinus oedipus TaxID=9490 RepID=A0ABQ9V1C6_SAGOE|nr:hypothetical protein P7K49_017009 [Saguinus oedipus]